MRILAIDDEKLALEALVSAIHKAAPNAETAAFQSANDALDYAKKNRCDAAFLDVEMRGMNGMELAENLLDRQPKINLIFVTGYSEYASEAFRLRASGYILKPVTPKKVRTELDNLRTPVVEGIRKLRIQTFGNFEVYYENRPLHFTYTKTKELLAYLVDRAGAMCTNGEIAAALWGEEDGLEETNHESYLKNLRADLKARMQECGCEAAFIHRRGLLGLVPEMLYCDYFSYLAGAEEVRRSYRGEYMSQYSWAELTHAALDREMGIYSAD